MAASKGNGGPFESVWVYEYEANYMNAVGYLMYSHEVALKMRGEAIQAKEDEESKIFDLWPAVAVRYCLGVTGLRCEF